ncbi:MAG TPA: hypothetical protein VF263_13700 [Longimicrobiaceae bacterium]
MAFENRAQEDSSLMLFVNSRPSRAEGMATLSAVAEAVRASEAAWAERNGIEDAPFRIAGSRTDFSTITETATHNGDDTVNDKQSPDFADSEYATPTERNVSVRDRQSGD